MKILLTDIAGSLVRWRIWLSLAYEDLQDRFRRTYLGLVWISITYIAFIAAYIFVFSRYIDVEDADYRVYLLFGWAIWQLLSSIISDAAVVLQQARGYILSSSLPHFIFYFRVVARNIMTFMIMLVTAFVAAQFFDFHWSLNQLTIIPALIVYCFTGIWVCAFFGPVVAKFEDLNHVVSTFMRVAFFMTPIIWYPATTSRSLSEFTQYNPFYHFIEIGRAPMVFNEIAWDSWIYVGVFSLVMLIAGAISFMLTRRWVPFWL